MAGAGQTVDKLKPKPGGGGPGGHSNDHGYGGGGNNDGGSEGFVGPRERLRRYRLGLAVALVSVVMLFLGLSSAYVVRQGATVLDLATGQPRSDWIPLQLPALLWLNTVLLVLSSATLEMARRAVFREGIPAYVGFGTLRAERSRFPWLGLTLLLGGGFLYGQYAAWRELYSQGIYLATNPASSFFYMFTGLHALHLLFGVVALLFAGIGSLVGQRLESRQITLDVTTWYWHFMGGLWVYLLALLYWVG